MKTSSRLYASIALMAVSIYAQAFPGESIVLDPVTGNYTITYVGDAKASQLSQTTFVPSTKIAPAIRSRFSLSEREGILYRYTVSNGPTAKQSIVSVVLEQIANPVLGEIPDPTSRPNLTRADLDAYVTAEAAALSSPNGWDGSINRDISNIGWSPKTATFNTGGIHPGQTLSGFGFNSLDLPGMGPSWMAGLVGLDEIFGFPDEGPVKKSAVLAELNQLRDNDFITRPAAVPTIAVPEPFDAAATLERIQTHIHGWIAMQLLDPAFSAQLDRSFQSAISAYRLNQPKVGKQHIQAMRALIKKEQPDADREDADESDELDKKQRALIDKLAARILDFDLKYVTKRMSGDD